MSIIARYSIFSRLSSVGKTDLALVTLQSWRLKPSMALVVSISRRTSWGNLGLSRLWIPLQKPHMNSCQFTVPLPSDTFLHRWSWCCCGIGLFFQNWRAPLSKAICFSVYAWRLRLFSVTWSSTTPPPQMLPFCFVVGLVRPCVQLLLLPKTC